MKSQNLSQVRQTLKDCKKNNEGNYKKGYKIYPRPIETSQPNSKRIEGSVK